MNVLPVAAANDWPGSSSQREAQPSHDLAARHEPGSVARDAGHCEPDADAAGRPSLAQQSVLELRLEAALGRLAAMETLLEAERLHVRQAQTALGVAERALQRHRETIVASDRHRQEAASEIERLKQGLHLMALDKARQANHIAALLATVASQTAEIARLEEAGTGLDSDLRAARARPNLASDAMQRECLRLEEIVQGERRDKLLLQRALDLARANRRALQDQLLQPAGPRPLDHRIALRPSTDCRAMAAPSTVRALPAFASRQPLPPPFQPLEQDGPMQPSCPALTEHVHATCD